MKSFKLFIISFFVKTSLFSQVTIINTINSSLTGTNSVFYADQITSMTTTLGQYSSYKLFGVVSPYDGLNQNKQIGRNDTIALYCNISDFTSNGYSPNNSHNAQYLYYSKFSTKCDNIFYDSVKIQFSVKLGIRSNNPHSDFSTSYSTSYESLFIIDQTDTVKTYISGVHTISKTFTLSTTLKNVTMDSLRLKYIPLEEGQLVNIYDIKVIGYNGTFTASVNDISFNKEPLRVFPNPSNGQFEISFNSEKNKSLIEVYDIQGRLVMINDEEREVGHNKVKMNLESVSTGIYIIRVENQTYKVKLFP